MGFTWTKSLMTGIKAVDDEHQALIEQVEKLYEAMSSGQGNKRVKEILDFIERYTKEHFQHEEKLYEKYAYPDLKRHKEIHRKFIADFEPLKEMALSHSEDKTNAIKINKVAMNWLMNHIGKEDKKACLYIKENQ